MNRNAVLIESSDARGLRDLPGARVDIENWVNFLKSFLGGGWTSSEIKILRKPFASDVSAQLRVESDCYTFVAFSGHGDDGSVVLNDYEQSVPLSALKPKSKRGAIVVDSCRGIGAGRYNFSGQSLANVRENSLVAVNAKEGRSTRFKTAETYLELLTNADLRSKWEYGVRGEGIVEMLACSRGQGASDDPISGGYYTSLLMAGADSWNKQTGTGKIYSTKDAHDFAARNLGPQQTPEYRPPGLSYPFAIKG